MPEFQKYSELKDFIVNLYNSEKPKDISYVYDINDINLENEINCSEMKEQERKELEEKEKLLKLEKLRNEKKAQIIQSLFTSGICIAYCIFIIMALKVIFNFMTV